MNVYFKYLSSKVPFFCDVARRLAEEESIKRFGATLESGGKYGIFHKPNESLDFLAEQRDIDYDPLYFQNDIHKKLLDREMNEDRLSKLESQFGDPWLTDYLVAARETYYEQYDHEELKQIIGNLMKFYIDLFDEFQPDVFITEDLGSVTTLIPFHLVSEKYGGTSIWAQTTRVRDRYSILRNPYDQHESIHKLFKQFRQENQIPPEYLDEKKQAAEFVASFRAGESVEETLDVVRGLHTSQKFNLADAVQTIYKNIHGVLQYAWLYNIEGYNQDYKIDATHKQVLEELRNRYRRMKYNTRDVFETSPPTESFVYFPLHFQPEWSTLVLAPKFTYQPGLIDQISKSIPLTHKLYVKEHPKMIQHGYRPQRYYETIKQLSNVRLIHPDVDSHGLIQRSDAVTTITGTAGLEAMIYKKPVITFGRVNYNPIDGVQTCSSISQLAQQLHEAVYEHQHDERELMQFLTALFAESFVFNADCTVAGSKHPDYEHSLENLVSGIRSEAFDR